MPQRLNSYFAANQDLREWSQQAQRLAILQRQYQKIAPSTLARTSQVIGFEQGTLTLAANNGAIAAKLRQLAPQLVLLLQGSGAEVTGILIKVQVIMARAQHPERLSLSRAGQRHLVRLADTLHDSPLKSALQRLSKTQVSNE